MRSWYSDVPLQTALLCRIFISVRESSMVSMRFPSIRADITRLSGRS